MSAKATQTTELSAINSMLQSIGERPIQSVANSQRLDVQRATSALNETNVVLQTRGWWFNTETNVLLQPNGDAEYVFDADVCKVDPYDQTQWQFVQRGRRLWDKVNHRFNENTADLYLNQTRILDFEDCPETFKAYVARRAGVLFQTRTVGSPTLFEFTEKDTNEAYLMLQQEEVDNEDINLTYADGTRDAVYDR